MKVSARIKENKKNVWNIIKLYYFVPSATETGVPIYQSNIELIWG